MSEEATKKPKAKPRIYPVATAIARAFRLLDGLDSTGRGTVARAVWDQYGSDRAKG